MKRMAEIRRRVVHAIAKLDFLPPLLARLTLGVLFISTGWGKVHHLGKIAGYFAQLHIPYPAFNAALVGWCELVCGALLLVGLLSRVATIPLFVTMIVALATARAPHIHGLASLAGQVELAYVVLLVAIAVIGPGAVSLDAAIVHGLETGKDKRKREPAWTAPPIGLTHHPRPI